MVAPVRGRAIEEPDVRGDRRQPPPLAGELGVLGALRELQLGGRHAGRRGHGHRPDLAPRGPVSLPPSLSLPLLTPVELRA